MKIPILGVHQSIVLTAIDGQLHSPTGTKTLNLLLLEFVV